MEGVWWGGADGAGPMFVSSLGAVTAACVVCGSSLCKRTAKHALRRFLGFVLNGFEARLGGADWLVEAVLGWSVDGC